MEENVTKISHKLQKEKVAGIMSQITWKNVSTDALPINLKWFAYGELKLSRGNHRQNIF